MSWPRYIRCCLRILALCWMCALYACPAARAQSEPAPERVRADVRAILSSPEFAPAVRRDNFLTRLLKRMHDALDSMWEWLKRQLRRRSGIGASMAATPGVQWFVITLFGAAAVWLLVRLAPGWAAWLRKRRRAPKAKAPEPETAPIEEELGDADTWLARAREQASHGEYAEALRTLLLASLARLNTSGAIRYTRWRTNGEYLRLLGAGKHPRAAATLRPLAQTYERHWYGQAPATSADFEAGLTAYDQLAAPEPDRSRSPGALNTHG